jgi:5,10-methylenetetrahydromethanopterin reductase
LSELGKISVNINGDLPDSELVDRARIAEDSGIRIVWIGETPFFRDPFEVAAVIADATSLIIGFGTVSPLRRKCENIIERFEELLQKFGEKFILALSPGEVREGREGTLETVLSCISIAKEYGVGVLAGCSGRRITERASEIADGILFNYVYPDHIRWVSGFLKRKVFTAAYGPSLLLPSPFFQDLLIACAIVMGSNRGFLKEFGYLEVYSEISSVNLDEMIVLRQGGFDISRHPDSVPLMKHSQFLLDRFSICGSISDIETKIEDLLKLCDHVVLGDPLFRDRKGFETVCRLSESFNN